VRIRGQDPWRGDRTRSKPARGPPLGDYSPAATVLQAIYKFGRTAASFAVAIGPSIVRGRHSRNSLRPGMPGSPCRLCCPILWNGGRTRAWKPSGRGAVVVTPVVLDETARAQHLPKRKAQVLRPFLVCSSCFSGRRAFWVWSKTEESSPLSAFFDWTTGLPTAGAAPEIMVDSSSPQLKIPPDGTVADKR